MVCLRGSAHARALGQQLEVLDLKIAVAALPLPRATTPGSSPLPSLTPYIASATGRPRALDAFPSVAPLFSKNRPFTAPRRLIIAAHPALQERAQTKTRAVMSALVVALRERGVPDRTASLAAQVGMTALSHAVAAWFDSESTDLGVHVEQAFEELRELTTFAPGSGRGMEARSRRRRRTRP
jgi:hypothetical protein